MAELRWAVFAAVFLVAAASVGFMFRYEPLAPTPGTSPIGLTYVWDRWEARPCAVGMTTKNKLICTLDEWERFGRGQ